MRLVEGLGKVDIHHGNEDSSNLADVEAMQNFKDSSNGSVVRPELAKMGAATVERHLLCHKVHDPPS